MRYKFTLEMEGQGETQDEAWVDAIQSVIVAASEGVQGLNEIGGSVRILPPTGWEVSQNLTDGTWECFAGNPKVQVFSGEASEYDAIHKAWNLYKSKRN